MTDVRYRCVDRVVPLALSTEAERLAVEVRPGNAAPDFEGVGVREAFWQVGMTLRVRFLDGADALVHRVLAAATDWTRHANLDFRLVDKGPAEIRVTFQGAGNWSAIGTDALLHQVFPKETMCLGDAPSAPPEQLAGLARHEFGHAIGLGHEHSSPESGIQWNRPVVLAELAGYPNYWDAEMVEQNVFWRYSEDATLTTEFDPHSVMLYSFDPAWTVDGWSAPQNELLSDRDAEIARRIYPGRVAAPTTS